MSVIVSLDKYYTYPQNGDSDSYIEYGRVFRELILKSIKENSATTFNILKDDELDESILNRYADYIIKRIINLGINILKIKKTDDMGHTIDADQIIQMEKDASDKFLKVLNEKLNLESPNIIAIHKVAYLICQGYIKKKGIPSKGEKVFIRDTASSNLHKCYICGRELDYNLKKDQEKRDTCEIEHIYPRVYGGSRNEINLTVCCENCNKIKDDMISSSDIHFEHFISNSSKEENIRKNIKQNIKLSLLLKQNLTCVKCEKKFFEVDSLESMYIIKKEEDDVFHYFNAEVCCSECFKKENKEGVKIELQL